MKIVNLETFRALPNGTVFSKYKPCVFDGLMIKVDTWKCDFLYQDLIGNIEAESTEVWMEKLDMAEEGESLKLDFYCNDRDGLYEKDQLFAVYEPDDIEGLIYRLEEAKSKLKESLGCDYYKL